MKIRLLKNKKGVTIIELLVVLVISGIVVAGIYRSLLLKARHILFKIRRLRFNRISEALWRYY
jgi:prepilin-type N-terminal cleavage/methylation domain-containing protein